MKTERELQKECLKYARDLGFFARKVETPHYRGFPDCLFIFEGSVFFVEFKHPNNRGRLSEHQKMDILKLEDAGVAVHVVNDFKVFKNIIAGVAGL